MHTRCSALRSVDDFASGCQASTPRRHPHPRNLKAVGPFRLPFPQTSLAHEGNNLFAMITHIVCALTMQRRQYVETLPEGAVRIAQSDQYYVTRGGDVYSTATGKIVKLRPGKGVKPGYLKVLVKTAGGKKLLSVHRLVAEAFVPNPLGLPEVNHRDLNKTNNADTNLEWMTHKANLAHARAALGNWTPKGNPKVVCPVEARPAFEDKSEFNEGKRLKFYSLREACDHFRKRYATFAPVVCRAMAKGWRAYGYWWKRLEPAA